MPYDYLPMKTRTCDFSGRSHAEENNISASFSFRDASGNYYTAELDVSPESFLSLIGSKTVIKPFPWTKFVPFTETEMSQYKAKSPNGKRKGNYVPDKGVNSIIASLVSDKITA